MEKKTSLETILDNYLKIVAPHQLFNLDEHIPIYNSHMQTIGYFNHRCYEDLIQIIKTANLTNSLPIGSS